jgi:Protein of unknown function (DUF2569)
MGAAFWQRLSFATLDVLVNSQAPSYQYRFRSPGTTHQILRFSSPGGRAVAAAYPETNSLQPRGIGGWLILPAIGTFLTPCLTGWSAYQDAAAFLSAGSRPDIQAFIVAEAIVNVALTIAWIVAAVSLVRHRRHFPRLYVVLCAIGFGVAVLDVSLAGALFNASFEPDDLGNILKPLVSLLVWGPYMFKSKRVRNTFVE